jgi:4-oxalocrotonate tautomerase family enzyme
MLVERFTLTLVEVCGSVAERVHVIIDEVDEDNWGRGGRLLSEIATAPGPKKANE